MLASMAVFAQEGVLPLPKYKFGFGLKGGVNVPVKANNVEQKQRVNFLDGKRKIVEVAAADRQVNVAAFAIVAACPRAEQNQFLHAATSRR